MAATPYARKLAKDAGINLSEISPSAANQVIRGKDVETAIASQKKIAATPLAKRYAEINGIDLNDIQGTGVRGKICKDDVLDAVQSRSRTGREPIRTPLTPIRKAIAKNMHTSLQNMAQTTISADIDVTELMRLRERLVAHADRLGTKITINDLLSYAAVKMVKENPIANASYTDTEIIGIHFVTMHDDPDIKLYTFQNGEQLYKLFLQALAMWEEKRPGFAAYTMAQLYTILGALLENETKASLPVHFLKAVSVIDISNLNLLILRQITCIHKIFVDCNASDIIKLCLGYDRSVNF